jgi:hypothetical protein
MEEDHIDIGQVLQKEPQRLGLVNDVPQKVDFRSWKTKHFDASDFPDTSLAHRKQRHPLPRLSQLFDRFQPCGRVQDFLQGCSIDPHDVGTFT